MRRFSSYGPVDKDLHYYVPRQELIDYAHLQLVGENPQKGGHYITVWAPRQTGKTWVMQQVLAGLRDDPQYDHFDVAKINLQSLRTAKDIEVIVQYIAAQLTRTVGQPIPTPRTLQDFEVIFTRNVLEKPLILILDEFDALSEAAISGLADVFRNIYIQRQDQSHKPTQEKEYLLHGVALIGVRSVLGVENVTGLPFNVQRGLHIPNLTFEEVETMFRWYERESGQTVEQAVVDRVFYETRGQPGLTSWFGELLTETYNKHNPAITARDFEIALAAATDVLPNNNILNIISKAKQEPYRSFVLELFETAEKMPFRYDDERINFLYLNGVIDREVEDEARYYVRFACPFVQKRLFNYFSGAIFRELGQLYDPFEDLVDIITDDSLNVENLIRRYERYLKQNRDWLLENAPRKVNLRIYEAVYHFNLYMYLSGFLRRRKGEVYPEFPTGNGKIDLIVRYRGRVYGIEVKSYTDEFGYRESLKQAARYGQQLRLEEITLVFFVERIDETSRNKYEVVYRDEQTGVKVTPVFVATGE
jgi:hypothetical protein